MVAFGANLGNREETLALARQHIAQLIGPILRSSRPISTIALRHPSRPDEEQPDYLNVVMIVESHVDPKSVLEQLLTIERELGRTRDVDCPWAARTIDLDLIAAEHLVIDLPELIVPHPEMHRRLFVLGPLAEVAPTWVHPVLKRTAQELIDDLKESVPEQ